ncbi:MAG TPA: efflux transporter outer membrane subunit, partial [Stellaceae bacterium]|nr:efflux transporter outer membrane subunit [Stellaceae bacterium]
AAARVEEARAARRGAEANLMPEITAGGDASRGNQGFATNNQAIGLGEANVQASWELDLFGKNQARAAQAEAIVESAEARRQAVLVTLLADVARNYFDLRDEEHQIAITEKNLATQQRTLALIQAQQQGALASNLDIERTTAQVATTSAQLPALRAARDVTLDRLNVLIGVAPGTEDAALTAGGAWRPLAPTMLVAAPASVLANRPDIRAAERDFAASLSASEAARKEIFPTISLTGLFGIQQSSLFGATPWGAGASAAAPLLDFGRIEADIDTADARQKQAFLTYQTTVLEGLEDMEDSLSLYAHEASRKHELERAAEGDHKAVELADQQYKAGYTGLLDLLVAQRDELAAEASLAASEALLRKDLVRIYAAAGGGWRL